MAKTLTKSGPILLAINQRVAHAAVLGVKSVKHGGLMVFTHVPPVKWTPFFGPRNAEIKLGFQVLLGLCFVAA
jgi:hypothetical protein